MSSIQPSLDDGRDWPPDYDSVWARPEPVLTPEALLRLMRQIEANVASTPARPEFWWGDPEDNPDRHIP